MLPGSPLLERDAIVEAADEILGAGLWCVIEVCLDVPRQIWEQRLVIFKRDSDAVADAVAEWIVEVPQRDARLSGCTRTGLHRVPDAPAHLCYVAPSFA